MKDNAFLLGYMDKDAAAAPHKANYKAWSAAYLQGYMNKEASKRVVIVRGNPKYDEQAKDIYTKLEGAIRDKGYEVEYDEGRERTLPNTDAHAWVGYSRGADRLRFGGDNIIKIPVGDYQHSNAVNNPDDLDGSASDAHFTITPDMLKQIGNRLSTKKLDNTLSGQ